MPLNYINSSFDYVGVLPSGGGNLRDRFNSTFRLITHIPAIKMVFTTSVQVVWYESTQTIYEDENGNSRYYLKSYEDKDYLVVDPMGYYDKQGHYTAWSPADADDADKSRIMYRTQPYLVRKGCHQAMGVAEFPFYQRNRPCGRTVRHRQQLHQYQEVAHQPAQPGQNATIPGHVLRSGTEAETLRTHLYI